MRSWMRGPTLAVLCAAGLSARAQDVAIPSPAPTAGPTAAPAEPPDPTVDLFARKCGSCHTVGKGIRVGPDLKDAHERRRKDWLQRFIQGPSRMLDADPEARQLLVQFGGVRMPDLGISAAEAGSLIALIERCSIQVCNLAGAFVPVTTATAQDVDRGRDLFLGRQGLQNGAAPCVSCHTVRGAGGGIPGGTLAKDLTHVYARLGDQGLDAALKSPAFPVMNKIFATRPLAHEEAFALRAFLYDHNRGEPAPAEALSLPLTGALGTVVVLGVLNAAWSRRLRGVRRALTRKENGRIP